MEINIEDVVVECVKGNIVNQPDVDAIVNAANAQLQIGGGVAGAIHRAAGPGLAKECRPLAPIKPGEAVITGGHNLPNKYVIHCLGPIYGVDKPEERLLANCYENALDLAERNEVTRIAFPAISTGAFGYPLEDAAQIAIKTVLNKIPELNTVKLIRFVLFSSEDLKVHENVLSELSKEI